MGQDADRLAGTRRDHVLRRVAGAGLLAGCTGVGSASSGSDGDGDPAGDRAEGDESSTGEAGGSSHTAEVAPAGDEPFIAPAHPVPGAPMTDAPSTVRAPTAPDPRDRRSFLAPPESTGMEPKHTPASERLRRNRRVVDR